MTLTLEDVRTTRFHLARRNGYEPSDVDDFVDKVEATFTQLFDENASLKQQLSSAGSAPAAEPRSIFVPMEGAPADESLKADLEARQNELDAARREVERLREESRHHEDEAAELRKELFARDEELVPLRAEAQTLRQGMAATQAVQPPLTPTGHVENITVTTADDASPAVARLLQMATEQSERLVGESQVEAQRLVTDARAEVERVIDNANRKAHETLTDARTRADRIESEARVNAEQVVNEAQGKADAVTTEAERRRSQLFADLEAERDSLRGRVDHLRKFESTFRTNLTTHLQSQLRSLSDTTFEPPDAPDLLGDSSLTSTTPRLDALLGS